MDSDSLETGETPTVATVATVPTPAFRITPVFAFASVGGVVLAYALRRGFVLAHRTLGWVVACSVVALLLDPLTQWLSRRLPRVIAIMLSVLTIIGVVAGVVAKLVTELLDSAKALGQSAPLAATRLEERSSVARDLHVAQSIKSFTSQLTKDLNEGTISRVKTVPTYIVTGILMLFLLTRGRRYLNDAVAQIREPNSRKRANDVLRVGLTRGRNRLLFIVVQIVAVTLSGFTVFELLDLRASFILAFVLGVASAMPFVGLLVAAVPAGIMAYGLHGVSATVIVAGFVMALQVVDLLWWRPFCDRRTVEVGLFLPLIATMIGYELYRIGGAVYCYALVVLTLALIAAADNDSDSNAATWAGES